MDPEPDPLVRGTDPRIRIRTKMSRTSTLFLVYQEYFLREYVSALVYLYMAAKPVYHGPDLHPSISKCLDNLSCIVSDPYSFDTDLGF